MPSGETRTADALKPRKALAASGKSRTVGTDALDTSGKRSTRDRPAGNPLADPLAQPGRRRGRLLQGRGADDVDTAGVAQERRIAQQLAGLAEQTGAHAGGFDQPGEKVARRSRQPVDRGFAARHRDLADAGRHHLALDRERGELGVDQLLFVVAEIDCATSAGPPE